MDQRTIFVEDLIARKNTLATLMAFHDWLEDNQNEKDGMEVVRLRYLRELIEESGNPWDLASSDYTLANWMRCPAGSIILSTPVTRDTLAITDRSHVGFKWFTWGTDSDDDSVIPREIMVYLKGWSMYLEALESFDYGSVRTDKSESRDPQKALAYACWDWGCDQVRDFFGVPKLLAEPATV